MVGAGPGRRRRRSFCQQALITHQGAAGHTVVRIPPPPSLGSCSSVVCLSLSSAVGRCLVGGGRAGEPRSWTSPLSCAASPRSVVVAASPDPPTTTQGAAETDNKQRRSVVGWVVGGHAAARSFRSHFVFFLLVLLVFFFFMHPQ